jgi:membrane protein required for colicin V production
MNWVDITIISTLVTSTLTGLFWGLIRQVIAIFGLVGGIMIAGRFYAPVSEFLHGKDGGGLVADANWARIIAFVGIVILFSLALGAAGSVLRVVAKLLFLGWLDHILGALLGFLMAITLVMSMLVVATVFPVPGLSDSVRTSQVAHWFSGYVPVVLSMLPPEFQRYQDIIKLGAPAIPHLP